MKRVRKTLWTATIKDQIGLPKELADTVISEKLMAEFLKSAEATREQFQDNVTKREREWELAKRVQDLSLSDVLNKTYTI